VVIRWIGALIIIAGIVVFRLAVGLSSWISLAGALVVAMLVLAITYRSRRFR
jgi:hypothetical protein